MKKDFEKYSIYIILMLALFGLVLSVSGFMGVKPSWITEKNVNTSGKKIFTGNDNTKTYINNRDNINKNSIGKSKISEGKPYQPISTGSTGPGDVSVELTPFSSENGLLKVNIAVNTHSVDLSQFDLKEITLLEYKDKFYKPVEAPALRGHHSNGILTFNISPENNIDESFTIKISGIPNVKERVFSWKI